MKTVIVYDRANKWGGAERVLLTLHEMFPDAPIYSSVYDEKSAPWAKVFSKIHTSFLQRIPFARRAHEFLGTFMPLAFETFNFDEYDLVISVTSEAAKGIITKPETQHVCYMLTPTRYLWSHYDFYFKNPILRFVSLPVVNYLRSWDKIASKKPDKIIAISTEVQKRIKKYYGRSSDIIFPPVETGVWKKTKRSYYLLVSRLDFGYKNVELAIKTFNFLKKPLVIVGVGREKEKLELMAGKNIRFVGRVSEEELAKYYLGAKALVMPQEEDFGIVAVEAQSYGTPVIAYGKGGAIDTVIDGKTGVLFPKQDIQSLTRAIAKFEKMSFNVKLLTQNAGRFSKEIFKRRLQETLVRSHIGGRRGDPALAQK
jgi:glycosyltransferase involved in cell wall biosynthesis